MGQWTDNLTTTTLREHGCYPTKDKSNAIKIQTRLNTSKEIEDLGLALIKFANQLDRGVHNEE